MSPLVPPPSAPAPPPRVVLFVCQANAARSPMAEGWARALLPDDVEVWSCGVRPTYAVKQDAVTVMAERGVDVSRHRPRGFDDVPLERVELLVVLCDDAACPPVAGAAREHWPTPDPAQLAIATREQALEAWRRARDGLEARVRALAARYADAPSGGPPGDGHAPPAA